MRAKMGYYTGTKRVSRCTDSKACSLCRMCINYNRRSAKCKDCYPHWPTHCICKERQMDQKILEISKRLDRPIFDLNQPGKVEFHSDPAQNLADKLNGAVVEAE